MIKRLIEKLKTLRLYFVMCSKKSTQGFHFKTKDVCTISIGDKVIDCTGMIGWDNDQGTFTVEKIDRNGWVWGSEMKTPYYKGKKLNFLDNNVVRKLN